jgi:hypothetical protein
MAKRTPKAASKRTPPRDMAVTVKMSPQEYQLISYAASRSRARGIQVWMRERLLEAAREKVPEKTANSIIEGRATADLLKESLKEARATKRSGGKVLEFAGRRQEKE